MNLTVDSVVSLFHKELENYYSKDEIGSFLVLIFRYFLGFSGIDLIVKKHIEVDKALKDQLDEILSDLQKAKPIQYILGSTEFYGLTFKVNEDVLIPRPETEELVYWIIKEHKNKNEIKILDVGTGSGCIAVSLKKMLPFSKVTAIDISGKALNMAKTNAVNNKVEIDFMQMDILTGAISHINDNFDIIVSNPPYVLDSEKESMHKNILEYEPYIALFAGVDPIIFYKSIADLALTKLKKNGKLYFEINENMAPLIVQMLDDKRFLNIQLKKDLNSKDRMICCSL